MTEKVEGIVLKETNYGETSKILNILTKEYGLIGVISKGCRSIKSELCSLSSKLTYGYFNIYYKEDKLSIIKSIDLIDSFKEIRKDIIKISYAGFLVELTEQVYKQNQVPEIYDIFKASLLKINEGMDPLVITNILELKYLDYLGVSPILDSCAICGTTSSIKTLSVKRGGYVCSNCHTNEYVVDQKSIKMLRMFYYVDIEKISNVSINDKIKKEVNKFLSDYYDEYTGLYLKSKNFLEQLLKIS